MAASYLTPIPYLSVPLEATFLNRCVFSSCTPLTPYMLSMHFQTLICGFAYAVMLRWDVSSVYRLFSQVVSSWSLAQNLIPDLE